MNTEEWTIVEGDEDMHAIVTRTLIACEGANFPVTVGNVLHMLRSRKIHVAASISQIEAWIAKYAGKDTAC